MQVSDGDRLESILKARVYFVDYLQRCKSYAITKEVGWVGVALPCGHILSPGGHGFLSSVSGIL